MVHTGNRRYARNTGVHGGSEHRADVLLSSCVRFLLAFVCALAFTLSCTAVPGMAKQKDAETSGTVTDTQNLLGSNYGKINDAINETHNATGVAVRLLYVANFTGSKHPDTWVSDALESTKPEPNTVLLAVASDDGRLVVAVSKNSDSWLKSQKNVDKFSDAALEPLQKADAPDWSGAALAMMKQIQKVKKDREKTIWIISGSVAAVALAAGIVLSWWRIRKRHPRKRPKHHAKSVQRQADSTANDTGE